MWRGGGQITDGARKRGDMLYTQTPYPTGRANTKWRGVEGCSVARSETGGGVAMWEEGECVVAAVSGGRQGG